MCAHDLEQVLVKYFFWICSRLAEQCSNINMKTARTRDRRSIARQQGGQNCLSQDLFWVLKEIPWKDLPNLSAWKHQYTTEIWEAVSLNWKKEMQLYDEKFQIINKKIRVKKPKAHHKWFLINCCRLIN